MNQNTCAICDANIPCQEHFNVSQRTALLEKQLAVAIKALKEIRSYSLGSKADICDVAFEEIEKLGKE